jgi:hypothetical protein
MLLALFCHIFVVVSHHYDYVYLKAFQCHFINFFSARLLSLDKFLFLSNIKNKSHGYQLFHTQEEKVQKNTSSIK